MVVSPSLAVFCELVFLDFVCFVYSTNLPIGFFGLLLDVFCCWMYFVVGCILLLDVFSYCQLYLKCFCVGEHHYRTTSV